MEAWAGGGGETEGQGGVEGVDGRFEGECRDESLGGGLDSCWGL